MPKMTEKEFLISLMKNYVDTKLKEKKKEAEKTSKPSNENLNIKDTLTFN